MLSLEEIQHLQINPAIAREAYEQVSQRLGDVLDTKKVYEQKAFTLFGGYLTVSLALLGVGGAIYGEEGFTSLALPFWAAGGMFVLGAILLMLALIDKTYGALASAPDMWLNKGTIDGPDNVLPLMLAYIRYHHQERIRISTRNNEKKAGRIRSAVVLGILAPLAFVALSVVQLSTDPSSQAHLNPAAAAEVGVQEPVP